MLSPLGYENAPLTTRLGARTSMILVNVWKNTPFVAAILLAGLQAVPRHLYEAARIDGATAWQQLIGITIPMISGALFFTLIINTVASLQLFSEVYTMFFGQQEGQTVGTERAALFYVIYLFRQAFEFFHMGYASAMAWLLFAVIGLITFAQIRLSRRFVYYEGE